MILNYSKAESDFLKIKVGRNTQFIEELDAEQLLREITENQFDLCRIKVNSQSPTLLHQLESMQVPYHIYTINYHNINLIKAPTFQTSELVGYEVYEARNAPILRTMLEQILDTRYWPEYQSDLLAYLIPSEQSKALALNYYSSFGMPANPGSRCWFLTYKKEKVGVFMGNIDREGFYGILYGILPAYRGLGLSKMIYNYMLQICYENNWKFFVNDVHIRNFISQKSAVSSRVVPKEIYFNIALFPLLSKTEKAVQPVMLPSVSFPSLFIFSEIQKHFPNAQIKRYQFKQLKEISKVKQWKAIHSFPILTASEAWVVTKFLDTASDELIAFAYSHLHLEKF